VALKKKVAKSNLAVRYLDDEIVLSSTHAWTYMRLPLISYEFITSGQRENLCDQITLALSNLVTSNQEAVEVHLRITNKVYQTLDWASALNERATTWKPTPGWKNYLNNMASFVESQGFEEKEVYLGICLGKRKGQTSGPKEDALAPIKKITDFVEQLAKLDDMVVQDQEVESWREKARDIHRSLGQSSLRAIPATSDEIAYVIAHSLWPNMEQPDPSVADKEVWGPGEVRMLSESSIVNARKWVEVEQVNQRGEIEKGYSVTLSVARFPDVLYFPAQEPWIHFAAALPFPVEFSTRFSLVPALKVQKDLSKKLAEAEDQAQHIAESGTSVPLAVREQLEVATLLKYQIDKDRMPWAYSRHRITVTGGSPQEVMGRAKTVIESYRELNMDIAWPSGDQFELLCESMPGDRVRSESYFQRQELDVISGGMPTASSNVGDKPGEAWVGPFLGHTTSRVISPVFFSPHVAMSRNYSPGVAVTGSPGAGKSFLAFTLAYQMAMQGVWTIYIDPKADAKPMGTLPGLGKPRVFDLREGNDGMLDPFSMGGDVNESKGVALETLRLLLGGKGFTEEREGILISALENISSAPNPTLGKIVDYLLNSDVDASKNLGYTLKTIRDLPFARLCFSASGGTALRPEDGLTIVTLLGLDLPNTAATPDDYSYENRLAVSVMYLLTRYARKLMLNMDKSQPKAICIDEAWAITSTPQGAKLIPEIARMGRSHNTALVLVSQNAGDLMEESVTNSLSTKFAFRSSNPGEISDVLELFGLQPDQGYEGAVRDLRNGECLMQDVEGRVSRVKIDNWNKQLFDTFNTNPETRGKSIGTKG
jgi:hypothetical protein